MKPFHGGGELCSLHTVTYIVNTPCTSRWRRHNPFLREVPVYAKCSAFALVAFAVFACSKSSSPPSTDMASLDQGNAPTADTASPAAMATATSKAASPEDKSPKASTASRSTHHAPSGNTAPQAMPKIDPGPPKMDVSSSSPDKVRACQTKSDCNDGMMTCTAQHMCVCDSSRGFGRPGQGDCLNYLTDANNCGKFGNACPSGQVCTGGHCGKFTCDSGETVCFDYCANLQKDNGDCGKCGHECPSGLSCVSGHCEP